MGRLALLTLFCSAVFLLLDALLQQSTILIYMSSALITLILVARLQRWYALSRLTVRRLAPATATVGDPVFVRFEVANRGHMPTPILSIEEAWPDVADGDFPNWMRRVEPPPPFSAPPRRTVEVTYGYTPIRRGLFQPDDLLVYAADAFGLARATRRCPDAKGPLLVLPVPELVPLDLASAFGWGLAETEAGQSEGGGIEPRGVRQWQPGDSLRHIHWRSSARVNRLQVKQFEAGHIAEVVLIIDTRYPGRSPNEVFEKAIRNAAYVAREFITSGTSVRLMGQGIEDGAADSRRGLRHYQTILECLAALPATNGEDIGAYVTSNAGALPMYSTVYVFTADTLGLRAAARAIATRSAAPVGYLYGSRDVSVPGLRVISVDTKGVSV